MVMVMVMLMVMVMALVIVAMVESAKGIAWSSQVSVCESVRV
jgi:hypothetical protein